MTINYCELPRPAKAEHRITSRPRSGENCIAHAAGAKDEWWEPHDDRIWPFPPGHPCYNYRVESLVCVYESLGYRVCASAVHEPNCEKIAIYGRNGIYEHAARQNIVDGTWTSKLGPEDDINHTTLEALIDTADGVKGYGNVVVVMSRSTGQYPPSVCCRGCLDATK